MIKTLLKILLILCSVNQVAVFARSEPFILGADISWIPEHEAGGVRYADKGQVKDILEILKEHRFNWIRLRLFVDPTAKITDEVESPYSSQGFCDLQHTVAMAKRVKGTGMKLLLDFHYSDTWADPKKQHKPVVWQKLTFGQLKDTVRAYTKAVLLDFKKNDVLPDMVQIGNEVKNGMLWPDGKISSLSNFAALINAGIDGVKDVDTSISIMIHSISEGSPSDWLKNLINAGVKRIDVFGLSYYSEWHGTPDSLQKMVDAIVDNHNIEIAIAEYADNHRKVNDIIYNLDGERGLGTFVWEPCDWSEVLFDWKNNRRETNDRIDIYPQLSKEYGNDDFVNAQRVNKISYHLPYRISFQSNGVLIAELEESGKTHFTLVTPLGQLAYKWQITDPGNYRFNLFEIPGKSVLQSGVYLLVVNGQKKKREVFRVPFFH